MDMQKLNADVIAKIRSSSSISTLTQCAVELVLNSLDAKATAIAVRVNCVTLKIQVVDNGDGIPKGNLKFLGVRYMTNKCSTLKEFEKNFKYFGYRGEALANISECSQCINITSKHAKSKDTYNKTLSKHVSNEIRLTRNRPSVGSTVTVEGFFHCFPVRRKRIVPELEFEDIKKNVKSLILVHPNVSFSVRNDVTDELVLNYPKQNDVISSFKYLHPEIGGKSSLMKTSKKTVSVEALLFKKTYDDKTLQFIYVNKRPVVSSKAQKFVVDLFNKNRKPEKKKLFNVQKNYPIYVINIKCKRSEVNILQNTSKTLAEFKNWELVTTCLQKLIYTFFGNEGKLPKNKKLSLIPEENFKSGGGTSRILGAYRGCAYKRKHSDGDKIQKHVPDENIIEETQISTAKDKQDEVFSKPSKNKFVLRSRNAEMSRNQNFEKKDMYDIDDATPLQEKPKKKFKKPLDIQLLPKNDLKSRPAQEGALILRDRNERDAALTKIANDEWKGKHLIMDMFLKSTQVFNSDENMSDARSEETVYEAESNFQMEKNFQTKVNGMSKTMSVSVNVKSMKKIKKPKLRVGKLSHRNLSTKAIQTTLIDKTSKCVQTSLLAKRLRKNGKSKHKNDFVDINLNSDNYTVVYPNTSGSPSLKFVYQDRRGKKDENDLEKFKFVHEHHCICSCHEGGKLFNFEEETGAKKTAGFYLDQHLFEHKTNCCYKEHVKKYRTKEDHNNCCCARENAIHPCCGIMDGHITNKPYIKTQPYLPQGRSPYFAPPANPHRFEEHVNYIPSRRMNFHKALPPQTFEFVRPSENLPPMYWRAQFKPAEPNNFEFRPNEPPETSAHPLYEFTLDSFRNFRPEYLSTQKDEEKNATGHRDLFSLSVSPFRLSLKTSADVHTQNREAKGGENQKNLFDFNSLSQTKTFAPSLPKKDLFANKQMDFADQLGKNVMSKENFEEGAARTAVAENPGEEELPNGWLKKYNKLGDNYYINTNTGFTTFLTPKPVENLFKLQTRLEFVPKGMSPVMKEIKIVDKSLSQNSKDKLLDFLMETYKQELLYIKWQNYLENIDPKTFFENMYKEKIKMHEADIPNFATKFSITTAISFSKDMFHNIDVIGQVDKKFIATVENNLLILFDQHAVHERIRLEKLLKAYKGVKHATSERMVFFMTQTNLSLLKKHDSYLKSMGLTLEFFGNGVKVAEIPSCMSTKFKENVAADSLKRAVQLLIIEMIELLKSTRGTTISTLPKIIQNIINLEACRGAVKFGNVLSKEECRALLKDLSMCDLPFQCAHGRPTLTPLLTLDLSTKSARGKIDLKKLVIHNQY